MNKAFLNGRHLFLCCATLFLVGCISAPTRMVDFAEETLPRDASVGVVWLSSCSIAKGCKKSSAGSNLAEFAPVGASGLLIYGAVISAHQELIDALDLIKADNVVQEQFLQPVADALKARGHQVQVKTDFNYPGDFKNLDRTPVALAEELMELHPRTTRTDTVYFQEYKRDFSNLNEEMNTDYIVALEILRFAMLREFGPLGIPLTEPFGSSAARVYLINTQTNEMVFNDYGIAEIQLDGEWRQPGDWSNAHGAALEALTLATTRATDDLLSGINGISN